MKKLVLAGLLVTSLSCHAGSLALTAHSRANCVNNESITWWKGHQLWMRVISFHNYNGVQQHVIDTFSAYTWRAAAVCWGEAPNYPTGKWAVFAWHLLYDNWGKEYVYANTDVNNCSIYDGWWD
jgi:hypothetical protein